MSVARRLRRRATPGALLLAVGAVSAAMAANARWPRRSRLLLGPSWALAAFAVELVVHLVLLGALLVVWLVVAGALTSVAGVVGLALWIAAGVLAAPSGRKSLRTRLDVEGRTAELDLASGDAPRLPWWLLAFPFLLGLRPGVRRERGIVFAQVGRLRLKLDLFRPVADPGRPLPVVLYVHGGAWVFGSRRGQGLPMLNHLAANGFACVNIDYRLSPRVAMPEHVIDVKRAIAWVREHGAEHGLDPSFIAIAGGSAGGHLASLAALTWDDPTLQPGFEDVDTSVQACVSFYGAYDLTDPRHHYAEPLRELVERFVVKADIDTERDKFERASPILRVRADAPPFFVIHGDGDTLVPVQESRDFVARLRAASDHVVAYAEMPGGQHAFDLLPTWRSVPAIRGVERFLTAVHAQRAAPPAAVEQQVADELTQ